MPGYGNVAISAAYAAALSGPYTIAAKAEIWNGDTLVQPLAIEASSQLIIDRNAALRRTCSATLTDPTGTLVPTTPASALTVYGNELVMYRGITFPSGTQEFIQLGVFGMEDVTMRDNQGDLVITLNGKDRMRAIQRAGFSDVFVIPPATNVGVAIAALYNFCWSGPVPLTFYFYPTAAVTQNAPTVYKPGDDPAKEAMALAAAAGLQTYFDVMGAGILRPIPDPRASVGNPAWSYNEGPGNLTTELLRTQSRAQAPNYIIRDAMGSGVGKPVRGLAVDNNPASATYYRGKYGQVVDYQGSSLFANQAQAQAAANAALLTSIGSIEQLTNSATPKPDHDVDDVIEVTRVRSGLAQAFYVLDMITMGFGTAGLSQMVGRQVTV
jgi:Domain of unknown function (DUF5047)